MLVPGSPSSKIQIRLVWDMSWASGLLKDPQVVLVSSWAEIHCILVCVLGCRHSLTHPTSINTCWTFIMYELLWSSWRRTLVWLGGGGKEENVKLPVETKSRCFGSHLESFSQPSPVWGRPFLFIVGSAHSLFVPTELLLYPPDFWEA